jgi:hypothetical protein
VWEGGQLESSPSTPHLRAVPHSALDLGLNFSRLSLELLSLIPQFWGGVRGFISEQNLKDLCVHSIFSEYLLCRSVATENSDQKMPSFCVLEWTNPCRVHGRSKGDSEVY